MPHTVYFSDVPKTGPCLNCDKRQVGCHSTCGDYISYKDEIKTYKEMKNKEAWYNNVSSRRRRMYHEYSK